MSEDSEICSVCKDAEADEESDFNQQPICTECKETQCYKCGYSQAQDTTWHGKIICEDCCNHWCNACGDYEGGCDQRCPACSAPCDAECECEIECEVCKKVFIFNPESLFDRTHSTVYPQIHFEDYKCVCNTCWETNLPSKN